MPAPRPLRLSLSRQELALLAITAVWGSTFLVVHLAMEASGPWFFVGLRFLVAGLIAVIVFHRVLRGLRAFEVVAGAAIGVAIFFGYGLQTYGLQTITSSESAFITAFYVPLVPLLQWAVFRKAPRALTWVGVALAFGGLLLLAGPDAFTIGLGPGQIATLVSTLAIAAEVILIGVVARRVDTGRVTVVQLLVAGILGFVAMPITGEGFPEFSWVWLLAAVGLGVASVLIQLTMNWAQRTVSPTRATIIYAGEPVWAGVVGRIAGERLPWLAVAGAALIVVGTIVSELKLRAAPAGADHREVPPLDSDTLVDYPAGATSSTGTVLATLPVDGGLGVVLDRTAFHAVDAAWPDQPADRGTLEVDGTSYEVRDAVVGATEGVDILVGSDIPVKKGAEGWHFVVVHVVAADAVIHPGDEVRVTVDEGYRTALSSGHTACHLAALAVDAALADAWTKEPPLNPIGVPGFDQTARASSLIVEDGSIDVYRVGKSVRKRGFDATAFDDLDAVAARANAWLADRVASGAGIRIDRDGPALTDRRRWVCELPEGEAAFPCGGTHLASLAELRSITVAFERAEADGGYTVTMTTTAVRA